MDRGLIMEVHGRTGIVLTPDGRFEEVLLPRPASVGEEIEFPARGAANGDSPVPSRIAASRVGRRRTSLVAVAAALILGIAASVAADAVRADRTAVAYVDVDINPSVELGINRFNRVVSFEGIDDEAREMLVGLDLKRMDLEAAVREIASAAETHGYVKPGDEPTVLIGVTPAKGREVDPEVARTVEKAREAVSKHLESKQVNGTVEVIQAAPEIREKARQVNLSSGRLAVLLKAKEEGVDVGPDLLPRYGRQDAPDREERRAPPAATGTGPQEGAETPRKPDEDRSGSHPGSAHGNAPGAKSEAAGDGARLEQGGSAGETTPAERRQDGRASQQVQGSKSSGRLADLIDGARRERDWGRLLERYGEEVRRQLRDAAEKRRDSHPDEDESRGGDKQDKEDGGAKPVSKQAVRPGGAAPAGGGGSDSAGTRKESRENQDRRVPRRQSDRRRAAH